MFRSSPSSPSETQTLVACSSPLSLMGFSDDEEDEQPKHELNIHTPITPQIKNIPSHNNLMNSPLKSPPNTNTSNGKLLLNLQQGSTSITNKNPFNMSNTMDSSDDDLLVDIDSPLLEFGQDNVFNNNTTTSTAINRNNNSGKSSSDSSSSEKTSQGGSSDTSSSSSSSSKKSSSLKGSNSSNSIASTSNTNNNGGSTLTIKPKAKSTKEKKEKKEKKETKSPKKKKETPKKKVEFKKVESSFSDSSPSPQRESESSKKRKKSTPEEVPKKWKKKKVEEVPPLAQPPPSVGGKKSLCRQFTDMITEIKKTAKKKKYHDDLDVSEDDSDDLMDISSSEELLSSDSEDEVVVRKRKKLTPKKKKLFANMRFVISNSLIESDKEKLEKKIKEENGTIIRQLSSSNLDSCEIGKTVLISEKTSTKPTYLIALLLDIPILKKDWIFDSITEKKLITDEKTIQKYLLDRGTTSSRLDPSTLHVEKQTFNSSMMCCKKENRIFYGCRVKILGNEKELSSWISILVAGGAIIDNELTTQTSEGSNFIFVKDSNKLTEEDVEKATSMKLPILDGESLLQIVITLERKFSEEQVLNYAELSQITRKMQPLPSINLLEMSMPLIELPDETDVINNMDLIDKIEFGNFFNINEKDSIQKTSFTRVTTCSGDTICEKYYIHDMVVLDYLNEELICRIDSLYYCGNIPTLRATQYYSNPKRKLQKTERVVNCSVEHIKYKLNICGPTRHKSQHFYSNQRFNTKTQVISDILEDIKTVGETCLGLEQCKEHKFKWLPPFKTNIFNDHIMVSTLKWRKQLFQQGDFVLIKQKQSDLQIVGCITEMRENDTNIFAIPSSRKFPISQGSLFVEIFEKLDQDFCVLSKNSNVITTTTDNHQQGNTVVSQLCVNNSNNQQYKTTHQVSRLDVESIQHIQSFVAINGQLIGDNSINTLVQQYSNNLIIIH
ncbi:BRCT domain-containing protein [Naegleria gruberi]|uniref:BRCT domain-containing protein n=1 Tax=Naegleria gruberi TaxID=5762 RepID=D2VU02_NAEGR|nr:BRCT domain-containing protein [Naegleria gruberi]EFC39747.1 BRCT domain-containing protein [Naegleria gruberi]|eukprot:XP_002672491.1 BRCT domain-containing protein [Naegleria gruberi strain NEG-M]